ncbi:MAG: gluconokinase [Candidatus Nanopelagicaceae bacterium]|jgi:carbohydrate kinase (thermoresistant glucokinase family)
MKLVVMGVSGCGKTSVGEALAKKLSSTFIDGDDLHPQSNKEKMAAGVALTDKDRWPWLAEVGKASANQSNIVVACSALKRSYRDKIREFEPAVRFIHLHGTRELLEQRVSSRENHFMPASLLDSQLATLEKIEPDENGQEFDISKPVSQLVDEVIAWL